MQVSTHSHPKVAAILMMKDSYSSMVSTHSHPKVAAVIAANDNFSQTGFNTQPPEGGCQAAQALVGGIVGFNTQPPEGGCLLRLQQVIPASMFQHTATRRWLQSVSPTLNALGKFQHTATRRWLLGYGDKGSETLLVSTHSHPKVAAPPLCISTTFFVSTHSHPKVAATASSLPSSSLSVFQHTATRRWLPIVNLFFTQLIFVSTHSHPKVAALGLRTALTA